MLCEISRMFTFKPYVEHTPFLLNMSVGIHGSVNSQTVNYWRDLGDGFSLFMDWRHKPFKDAALMHEMTSFCCRTERLLCPTQYSNIGFNSSQNNQQGNAMTSKSISQRTDYSHNKDLRFHPQLRPKLLLCETNYVSDHFSTLFMSMLTDSVCLHF